MTSVNGHNNPRYTILDMKSRQNCSIFIVKIFLNLRADMEKQQNAFSESFSLYRYFTTRVSYINAECETETNYLETK